MKKGVDVSFIQLMQLCSSALPIGGFTYSQGMEWAVECQWICTEEDLRNWLMDLIDSNLKLIEIPLLVRMINACQEKDELALACWNDILLAQRETSELRIEEKNRGRALTRLLIALDKNGIPTQWQPILAKTQTAGFAWIINEWQISLPKAAQGFAWTWLENMVISGVKLIPLGQVAGQRILRDLTEPLTIAVSKGLTVRDDDIGSSSPALAYVSACHETQYTRLFRS